MSFAATTIRGADLNCRFAVNGMKYGSSVFTVLRAVSGIAISHAPFWIGCKLSSGRAGGKTDAMARCAAWPAKRGSAIVRALS